jgi:hypothetical protein
VKQDFDRIAMGAAVGADQAAALNDGPGVRPPEPHDLIGGGGIVGDGPQHNLEEVVLLPLRSASAAAV